MDEIWKKIPGYEDRYEVSNLGRVRSFVTGTGSKGAVHYLTQDTSNKRGYRRVTLAMNRKNQKFLVHKLVASLFVGPAPTPEHEVNHIDCDTSNNRWDNLEWMTDQENHDYKCSLGRQPRGITHGLSKLSEAEVREIRDLYAKGANRNAIRKQFGISHIHCTRIVNREVWEHLD
ncbi:HNH endonuclease [Burkholderia ambifaria]|uniref:HNH endonuclease n=1 Tax=Burkholderia ambifaria TaxID=152480 RepID=UPI001B9EB786|nr:HNH endonuclease [Burkholderia ambifaria]MBR8343070.1 HNH endonuclease [Burkholderia ambifaria]